MTGRQAFFAYATLLASVITFAFSFTRTTSGQLGGLQPTAEGRYHLSAAATGSIYVIDTVTGRTWQYQNVRNWYDMGTPVPTK